MEIGQPEIESFLFELYTQTGGDTEAQVSMHDIAAKLGIDQDQVATLAESLYIQGYAEMKTLSGGMGITARGMKLLNIKPPGSAQNVYNLPHLENLGEEDKKAIEKVLENLKDSTNLMKAQFSFWEQFVLDVKSIELQLMAPLPRTEVLRQLFISIKNNLPSQINDQTSQLIEGLLQQ